MDWSELNEFLPVGVILFAALAVVAIDLFVKHHERYILPWIGVAGCAVALGLTLKMESAAWFGSGADAAKTLKLGGAFVLDGFGLGIWAVACLAGGLSILSASHTQEDSPLSAGEFYGLNLLAVSGMMLLAVSHDFLTLLISLEIMSISTYILAGSDHDSSRSNEAALKYLVLGAFSTAFMLLGMAFYYGGTGSLSLAPAAQMPVWQSSSLTMLGMGLILTGALFKVGAAPFHFWIPDVYEGAPTSVTGLMAVGVKAAAFAVLARLGFETFAASDLRINWTHALEVFAVATMAIGNILAMRQNNVKRLLAYSGIAHTGYLLLALLIAPAQNDAGVISEHLHSLNFYLLTYGLMTLGAFGVLGILRDDGRPLNTLDDLRGLAKEHSGIALCMAVFMLSLAGLPPFAGFFAKFMIFKGAIQQGHVLAATLGILTSVASLYYYLRVVVQMFMSPANDTAGEHADHGERPVAAAHCRYAWSSNLLIYAAGIGTLLLGVLPGLAF